MRNIHTPSQVEGCVVDEAQHALFIGEEDKGIWRFDAKPNASTEGKLIIKAGGDLVADVEGISLYQGASIHGKNKICWWSQAKVITVICFIKQASLIAKWGVSALG
ncbi:phytase [Shewanella septentrionalis]|uniref:Phytase n=1 Tax=Shewanella septentrionalis TaxID=2952223 RepID=A0A9X2WUA7_9GAMM|nr:phytase [Shewanella septentrionalis]